MPVSEAFNEDNMIGMGRYADKFFDLAIVDPPYGIGEDGASNHSRDRLATAKRYSPKDWDRSPPGLGYFAELRRVSKNQIIWGANHFISMIAIDSPCWIVWDKDNSGDFADCELAWTSFRTSVRKFKYRWNGMLQEHMGRDKEIRIHPTQKPVALYKWLLSQYGKGGGYIVDTHLGSQSSRIAAYDMGFNFVGFELDTQYYDDGNKRFDQYRAQGKLF